MASLLAPDRNDMLIRHQPSGRFVIGACDGAAQIECTDFEEALRSAGHFAAYDRRSLWYIGASESRRPLADVFSFRRLWNEFMDQPAMRLTARQIQRFLGCDEATCTSVIDVLVELDFLRPLADGRYQRTAATHHTVRPLKMKRAGDTRPGTATSYVNVHQ